MFSKFSPFLFFSALFFFIVIFTYYSNLCLSWDYFSYPFVFANNFFFSFCMDLTFNFFFFMVSFVTFLVCFFSEFYLDKYNNKKFFFLTILFFFVMLILVSSSSQVNLITGWDWLGLVSLCLVMFYPNMTTEYNSFLTMVFNRMGDMFLVLSLCIFFSFFSNFFFMSQGNLIFVFLLSIFFCSLTKSAQFPFSSWLPAAMSAPTPISAMVHSSTLVTAGVFLMINFKSSFLHFFSGSHFLGFFFIISFFLGGLMANIELDTKKLVAFSTMSQISMILVFLFFFSLLSSLVHMLYHALFKTLLFCTCGSFFVYFFSSQNKSYLKSFSFNFIEVFLFLSVFSMSGLIFSSSFFSKDLVLESLLSDFFFFFFFFLLLGSSFTIFYCSKLIFACISFMNGFSSFFLKKTFFVPFLVFSFMMSYLGVFYKFLVFSEMFPLVYFSDVFFVSLFLFFCLFILLKMKNFRYFIWLMDISNMKVFTFSVYSYFFMKINNFYYLPFNDFFFFKPLYLFFPLYLKNIHLTFSLYFISFSFLFFFYFYSFCFQVRNLIFTATMGLFLFSANEISSLIYFILIFDLFILLEVRWLEL